MVDIGTFYVSDRAGKPVIYVVGEAPSNGPFDVRRLYVAHLDYQGRAFDRRKVNASSLELEFRAFDYEAIEEPPGGMLTTTDLKKFGEEVREEVYDAFPSSANFRRKGKEFRFDLHTPEGEYLMRIGVNLLNDQFGSSDMPTEWHLIIQSEPGTPPLFTKKFLSDDFPEEFESTIRENLPEVP